MKYLSTAFLVICLFSAATASSTCDCGKISTSYKNSEVKKNHNTAHAVKNQKESQ